MKLRSVRGTHDLYGDDIKKYNHIKDVVSNKAELQSFNELKHQYLNYQNYLKNHWVNNQM